MESGLVQWLATVGANAFRWSVLAFVVVNGLAVAGVVLTRDRQLVNRWTGRLLAVNLGLAATGLGIPLLTTVSRAAVSVFASDAPRVAPVMDRHDRSEVILRSK